VEGAGWLAWAGFGACASKTQPPKKPTTLLIAIHTRKLVLKCFTISPLKITLLNELDNAKFEEKTS
jgi:hypothetical protein